MSNDIITKLLDPKHPLLEEFREVAPGTLQHSKNVSNFMEVVGLKLKLDVPLCQVCGLYHDIGKMRASNFFSENQNGINPHDDLDPYISYQIITRHVGDSVITLLEWKAPREMLEIVSQHHGNTVLRFFFNKATDDPDESEFRYSCPQPSSVEAATLMICDCVEATAKTMLNTGDGNNLSEEDKEKVVYGTIRRLEEDGQLDDMRVGDLKLIKGILSKELGNMDSRSVIYPEEDKKKVKAKRKESKTSVLDE